MKVVNLYLTNKSTEKEEKNGIGKNNIQDIN